MYFRFKTLRTDNGAAPDLDAAQACPSLSTALRQRLIDRHHETFDWRFGGPSGPLKYLDIDAFEYMARRAVRGDLAAAVMARMTLDGALQLIDPEDGGVRQYATGPGWTNATALKTLRGQACMLHALTIAGIFLKVTEGRRTSDRIMDFIQTALRADGGLFWTAVPKLRSGAGHTPERATTRTRDNAQLAYAAGFAASFFCSQKLDDVATRILNELIARRRFVNGGFGNFDDHGETSTLADTLAASRALFRCHTLNQDKRYLCMAQNAMAHIEQNHRCAHAGYYTSVECDRYGERSRDIDENIGIARLSAAIFASTGEAWLKRIELHALAYLYRPAVVLSRSSDTGILLAAEHVGEAVPGDSDPDEISLDHVT